MFQDTVSEQGAVIHMESLPDPKEVGAGNLLIYDEVLESVGAGALSGWLAGFPVRYPVQAGESLKDLAGFPRHVEKLLTLLAPLPASQLAVVALGGGSVGDFAGFFASVFKRGVSLMQIPSTWLAAIDSAHGGKNALNVGLMKNQIGTYCFAKRVYLSRAILALQPEERVREAFGELAKTAILDGGAWVKELIESPLTGGELLWRFLFDAVSVKGRVVAKDPFERLGVRQTLNLGHTIGHVLETVHALPHGLAVAQGLYFALNFSLERGLLPIAEHQHLLDFLRDRFALDDRVAALQKIPPPQFLSLLTQDKKRSTSTAVRFVFLRALGRPEVAEVSLSELLNEAIRQGYVPNS